MSTERFKEKSETTRRELGQLAHEVRESAREVRDELRGLERERENVLIGYRATVRDITDEEEALLEEAEQIRSILDDIPLSPRVSRLSPAAADEDNDDDAVIVEPMPTRVEEEEDEGDFFIPPTPPTPAPTPPAPVPTQPEPQPAVRQSFLIVFIRRMRRANGITWLLALIGLLLGLLIGSNTAGFDEFVGFGHGLFAFLWVSACAATGFFLGGNIGLAIEDRE